MPPFEYDELPQPQRVIAPARKMLVEQPLDERGLEILESGAGRRQKRVDEQLAKIAAEPYAKRHTEALLRPVEQIARQQARRHFLQHVLAPAVFDLHRRGQRRGEREYLVVEQRHARLERV